MMKMTAKLRFAFVATNLALSALAQSQQSAPSLVIVGRNVVQGAAPSTAPAGSIVVIGHPSKSPSAPALNPNLEVYATCLKGGYQNCAAAILFKNMLEADQRDAAGRTAPWILQAAAMSAVTDLTVNTQCSPQAQINNTAMIRYPIQIKLGHFTSITGRVGREDLMNFNLESIPLKNARSAGREVIAATLSGNIGGNSYILDLIPSCDANGSSSSQDSRDDQLKCSPADLKVRSVGGYVRSFSLANVLPKGIRNAVERGIRSEMPQDMSASTGSMSLSAHCDLRIETSFDAHDLDGNTLLGRAGGAVEAFTWNNKPFNLVMRPVPGQNSFAGRYEMAPVGR